MIDLHCHLLPFIDDGPATWEESIALARQLASEGVNVIAATPHGYANADPDQIRTLVDECQSRLSKEGISVSVIPGTEILAGENVLQKLRDNTYLCYGDTKTILLETSAYIEQRELNSSLSSVTEAGYRVLFAHPEKLTVVYENPGMLRQFVQRGILVHINASNFVGRHGEMRERVCMELLGQGLVHAIASDAHSATGDRVPAMKAALQKAKSEFGSSAIHFFTTNPEMILKEMPLRNLRPNTR